MGELTELDADLLSCAMTAGVERLPTAGRPLMSATSTPGSQAAEAREMPHADDH